MLINKEKYQDTVLYLCQKLGGRVHGKKKLAKLLYFADFDFYEKYEKPITGDTYTALPMGPFPSALDEITDGMVDERQLSIESVPEREGYNPTEIYTCLTEPKYNALDVAERKMLDRITVKYGNLNGRQLEELSHAEAPYLGTELKQEIPYELAFYRGTDFNDL